MVLPSLRQRAGHKPISRRRLRGRVHKRALPPHAAALSLFQAKEQAPLPRTRNRLNVRSITYKATHGATAAHISGDIMDASLCPQGHVDPSPGGEDSIFSRRKTYYCCKCMYEQHVHTYNLLFTFCTTYVFIHGLQQR